MHVCSRICSKLCRKRDYCQIIGSKEKPYEDLIIFVELTTIQLDNNKKKMKQIIFIFMAILLTTGMISAQDNKAVISAEVASHDFGTIKESEGKVSHTFKIKNAGGAPLVLTRVIASCGCTTPEWTKEPIAPGNSGDIKITYDPKDRPGPFAKTISVYSNGKTGSYILTIRGIVE